MIQELVELIKEANNQYRLGTPIMSDFEYDSLISELSLICLLYTSDAADE